MRFSTFGSLYDTRPVTCEGWEAVLPKLKAITVTEDKHDCWMYTAAAYAPDTTRANRNVLYLSLAIVDLDAATEEQTEKLLQVVEDGSLAGFYHTTFSYMEGLREGRCKGRLLLPFDRPVDPSEWDQVWHGLKAFCLEVAECPIDPACKDPSRAYFGPAAKREEDCLWYEFDGTPIEVDMLLDLAPAKVDRTSFRAPSSEVLSRIETSTRYKIAKSLLTTYPEAVEGQMGDQRTYLAACIGNDCGLTAEEFWPLLREYNQRCRPPWGEDELWKKLENAYKYGTLPQGWRLVGEGQDDAVTSDDISKLITSLLRNERKAPLARIIRSMLNGEALLSSEPAQVLLKVGELLGNYFPQAPPKQLANHFEQCIEATDGQDVTLDALATHIKTTQEDRQAREAANRLQIQEAEATRLLRAFRTIGVSRATPYSAEELEDFQKRFSYDGEADKSWIIRHGDTYYLRILDRYVGPFTKDAWNAAETILSPSNCELYSYTKNGLRPKTMTELVSEYGVVAQGVVLDMTAQKSYFDHATFTMYEAPCPRRDIEPKFHKNVDRLLLHICCGDTKLHRRLNEWLASVIYLDQPTAALMLFGAAQTGKSLLGNALSRIYTPDGPTEIEDIAGNFNSALAKCPLVFADETTPREGGQPNTRLMRKLVTQHTRTYRRKFIPDARLRGALRLVLAANNLDGLISTEDVNEHDVEALCERFLLIHIETHAAKRFLTELPETERREITHYSAIPEHVLWLAENLKVKWGQRLLVEGFPESELAVALRSRTGLRPEVVEFIGRWLSTPQKIQRPDHQPLVHTLSDGRTVLLMTPLTLKEHWLSILGDKTKIPRLRNLARALEALSLPKRRRVKNREYYELDIPPLRKYLQEAGFSADNINVGLSNVGLQLPLAPVPHKP